MYTVFVLSPTPRSVFEPPLFECSRTRLAVACSGGRVAGAAECRRLLAVVYSDLLVFAGRPSSALVGVPLPWAVVSALAGASSLCGADWSSL